MKNNINDKVKKSLWNVSTVLGIVALFTWPIIIGFILAIIGLIWGIVKRKESRTKVGIVLNIIAICISIIYMIFGVSWVINSFVNVIKEVRTKSYEETTQNDNGKIILNERQKNLLASLGLPEDYEELTISQKNAIVRIEAMLNYLENKYGITFIYDGYVSASVSDKEHLLAYPEGISSDNIVTVYSSYENEQYVYEDDFNELLTKEEFEINSKVIFAKPYYDRAINEYINKYYNEENFKIFTNLSIINKETNITEKNAIQNLGGNIHLFFDKSVYEESEMQEFINDYSEYIKNNISTSKIPNNTYIYVLERNEFEKVGQYTYSNYIFKYDKGIYISENGHIEIFDGVENEKE